MEQEVIVELTETTARSKSNTKRIDKLEERQDNLDRLVGTMAAFEAEQKHIKDDVTEIKADVKALTGKAGQRWDGVVDKVLWLLVGGLITYALASIGINI